MASNDAINPAHRPGAQRKESQFIAAARFLMIAGLVFHHMFRLPDSEFYPRDAFIKYTALIPDLINGLVHMSFMAAVPLLSVISGFLFFRRAELRFDVLLKKRFFSVVLPALIWCLFWLLFGFLMYEAGKSRGWFEWANYDFEQFGILTFFNAVVGVTREPWAFQFWFVHDLVLTLILSPVIYLLINRFGLLTVGGMLGIWLIGMVPPPFFSLNVLFFFVIGAYLGLPRGPGLSDILEGLAGVGKYAVFAFIAALLLRQFSYVFGEYSTYFLGYYYLCGLRILGVIAFSHLLYQLVQTENAFKHLLIRYSGYSFFVFAAHYPVIDCVKTVATRIPGALSQIGYFGLLIAIPGVTLIICLAGGMLIERYFPALFRLLNGGRAGAPALRKAPAPAAAASSVGY